MNFFKIPLCWPFKMVPSTSTPGIHFDDDWSYNQIKNFERKFCYQQKWKRSNTTQLQIESSISPQNLKVYGADGKVKKTFEWNVVFSGISYSIYEITFDISDLPEAIYYIFQEVSFDNEITTAIDWKAISEPIWSKDNWPNTLLFTYWNSFNDFDIAWTTGIKMSFRCEAGIMDLNPQRGQTDYIDQLADRIVLSGYPSRQFKLYIGTTFGVPEYIIDILNRIFDCDHVSIEGKLYTCATDKWAITKVHGFPLVGASIDIVPTINERSLEFSDTTPLAPGIVTTYNIETGFFGPSGVVPITEVEETN